MITILQEITDWDCHNGFYHVNDHDYLVGYQKDQESKTKVFKNPMKRFSKARRKFVVRGTYEDQHEVEVGVTWKFTGSKGNTYVVSEKYDELSCTCPGFRFRGQCKHVTEVSEM